VLLLVTEGDEDTVTAIEAEGVEERELDPDTVIREAVT